MKKATLRTIKRGFLIVLALFVLLAGSYVSILAFPQIIVSESVRDGTVVIYYDGDNRKEVQQLAADVESRLKGSGFYDSTRTDHVYFFTDHDLYAFFARLVRVPPEAQGFNLPLLGNSFVTGPTVAALGARTSHHPKYSIWEGDPAHTIAHEIGHDIIADRIGSGRWRKLPHWKQEGLPEYVANIGLLRQDSVLTLPHRIRILENDADWRAAQNWHRHGWDRIHYEAGLLVEYLFEVKGYTLDEILDQNIIRETTYREMKAWAEMSLL